MSTTNVAPQPKKGHLLRSVILIIVGLFVLLCIVSFIGSQLSKGSATKTPGAVAAVVTTSINNTAAPSLTSAPTNTPGPTNTLAPTNTPAPTDTPKPTATETIPPKPLILTGNSDEVVDVNYSWGPGAILDINYTGGGNFAIESIDENNENIDLVVNVIGKYTGKRMIDVIVGENQVKRLKISASGKWAVTISPMDAAHIHVCTAGQTCKGTGDDIVGISGTPDTGKVVSTGKGNFAILSFGSSGRDLLVNEIGAYTGTILFPNGTVFLQIDSDGPWTMDITSK